MVKVFFIDKHLQQTQFDTIKYKLGSKESIFGRDDNRLVLIRNYLEAPQVFPIHI